MRYLFASIIAGIFLAIVQFGTDRNSSLGFLGFLIVPGYAAAALLFPGGIHSGSPDAFVIAIVLLNALIYGVIISAVWKSVEKRRSRTRGTKPS
jgi:hypothetical protein